jgi:hypothetical protein
MSRSTDGSQNVSEPPASNFGSMNCYSITYHFPEEGIDRNELLLHGKLEGRLEELNEKAKYPQFANEHVRVKDLYYLDDGCGGMEYGLTKERAQELAEGYKQVHLGHQDYDAFAKVVYKPMKTLFEGSAAKK